MTIEQFWYDDIELFYVYQKAYINRIHTQAHINGLYINLALSVTFGNMFKKNGSQAFEYPKKDVFNPFNENVSANNQSYIASIDTTKNNNKIYQIKKLIEERRKHKVNG